MLCSRYGGQGTFFIHFLQKEGGVLDSYDNDWLFLDDDLFSVLVDEYEAERRGLDAPSAEETD